MAFDKIFLSGQAALANRRHTKCSAYDRPFWRVFGQGAGQALKLSCDAHTVADHSFDVLGKVLSYVAVESTWLKHPRHLHAYNRRLSVQICPRNQWQLDQRPRLRRPFFLALRIGIFCRVQFVQTATVRVQLRPKSGVLESNFGEESQ